MIVCRPWTCGELCNTLRVWGSGCVCWAEARTALEGGAGGGGGGWGGGIEKV